MTLQLFLILLSSLAVLHLYFARFVNHFLHSLGLLPCREPFRNLLTQGMVNGRSYRVKQTGKYIPVDDVDLSGDLDCRLSNCVPLSHLVFQSLFSAFNCPQI